MEQVEIGFDILTNKKVGQKKCWNMLIFIIPAVAFALVFTYAPMFGLIMAFKEGVDFTAYSNPVSAIINAPNAGFNQFVLLFSSPEFLQAFRNTLVISVLKIVLVFPIPIFLAILITEIRRKKVNNLVQSIAYLPHFLSWAI
ncbi:MAG: sugar ABC transporter permease, partial [Clostridia bacterium]